MLLPLNRLAGQLRLPAGWLRTQAISGRIPCLRVGRRLLFNPEAVRRALADLAAVSKEVQHANC